MSTLEAVSVADEVWIATALLHREHPERVDFEKREILARALKEGLVEPQRPGVSAHVSSHAVAGKKPQPNDYRMLIETERGRRRLFRLGDPYHPDRKGKYAPNPSDIPSQYLPLLSWYETWKAAKSPNTIIDPLLALRGTGHEIWADEHADVYIENLRRESA